MLEKRFRADLIVALKEAGKEAFPIESAVTPGFPDMVVAGNVASLVELKVVPTRASKTTLHDLFEATQRAFQKRWWTTQAAGLWVAIHDEKDGEYQALALCPGLLDKTLAALTSYGITGRSITELVKHWRYIL